MNAIARAYVEFLPCHPEHIRYIVAQDFQDSEHRTMLLGYADTIAQSTVAISGWYGSRCLGACGLIDTWDGRACGWALLSKYAAPHLRIITKHVKFVLDNHPARRVEMVVRKDFPQGQRWARMLGFKCETPDGMESYFFDGADALQYVRIKR